VHSGEFYYLSTNAHKLEEHVLLFHTGWVRGGGGGLDFPTALLYELDVESTKTAPCERCSPRLFFFSFFGGAWHNIYPTYDVLL
jgi:hypothetical protein